MIPTAPGRDGVAREGIAANGEVIRKAQIRLE
jgi:hypothetical protein